MSYATVPELRVAAQVYGVSLPDDDACEHLLDLATRDVQRHLGARWEPLLLLPEQVAALRDGTVAQACFRAGQGGDFALGLDDGVASIGGVTMSLRTPPRFSQEAAEALADLGLYVRSGTVEAVDVEAP